MDASRQIRAGMFYATEPLLSTIEAVFAHAIEPWRRNDSLRGAHTVDQLIRLSYGCGVQTYYRLAYSQNTAREAGTCQEPMGTPQTAGWSRGATHPYACSRHSLSTCVGWHWNAMRAPPLQGG